MKITEIVWLSKFLEKTERKHSVYADEVEQVFANSPNFRFVSRGDVNGENLYQAVGQTDAGRYLVVFFIYKSRNRALVISAREASLRERKRYAKHK